MVKFQFFASKIVVLEPISKELDRVDLIAWARCCSFFISAAGRYTDSPKQWFYSHCLKIILQFVDVSKFAECDSPCFWHFCFLFRSILLNLHLSSRPTSLCCEVHSSDPFHVGCKGFTLHPQKFSPLAAK